MSKKNSIKDDIYYTQILTEKEQLEPKSVITNINSSLLIKNENI